MNPVLFLNGTSSAGKTTIARQFQKLWEEPSLYASIDSFIFMFPDHVLRNDEVRKVVLWPLISAFNRSLPNLAECGFPLIVDYVMESPVWLKECVEALSNHNVYFVGVKCPLEELERREQARGDRRSDSPAGNMSEYTSMVPTIWKLIRFSRLRQNVPSS